MMCRASASRIPDRLDVDDGHDGVEGGGGSVSRADI